MSTVLGRYNPKTISLIKPYLNAHAQEIGCNAANMLRNAIII